MSPKSLTFEQKENQRQFIFEKSKTPMLQYGFKKVSVDDIVKAAEIAKGTFYLYFKSKEDFLIQFIMYLSDRYYIIAEEIIKGNSNGNLKDTMRQFFNVIFDLPEFIFFFKEHREVHELAHKLESSGFFEREREWFEKLLILGKVDTDKVKPEIVHNYIHAIYISKNSDFMEDEYKKATIEIMIEGLVSYIFN